MDVINELHNRVEIELTPLKGIYVNYDILSDRLYQRENCLSPIHTRNIKY